MARQRRKAEPPRLLTEEEQNKVVNAMELVVWDHKAACAKAGVRPVDGQHTFLHDESYKKRIGHLRSNILFTSATERARARGVVARDVLQEQWLNYILERDGSIFDILGNIDTTTDKGINQYLKAIELFQKIAFPAHVMHPKEEKEKDQDLEGVSLEQLQKRLADANRKSQKLQYTVAEQRRDSLKHGPPIDVEEGGGPAES